jgi:hypothetical protein
MLLLTLASPVAAAQQDPYPAPQQPAVATPTLATSYPPPGATAPPEVLITPAPIGAPLDGETTLGIDTMPVQTAAPSPNGMLYLWLGFVATLLIFTACVLGAIMLFARRAQP